MNSILSGWLKLLIVVLARKRVVVNSIRIQKWATHSYKYQMGYMFSATYVILTCGRTIFLEL